MVRCLQTSEWRDSSSAVVDIEWMLHSAEIAGPETSITQSPSLLVLQEQWLDQRMLRPCVSLTGSHCRGALGVLPVQALQN